MQVKPLRNNSSNRHIRCIVATYIAEAQPDEIYLYYNNKKKTREKMWRYLQSATGKPRAIQIIFEYLHDKAQGVSAYFIDTETSVEKKRIEKLIHTQETTDKP